MIGTLEEPLRTEVRRAFAESLAVIWQTMIGISGLGLLSVFLMREVPMGKTADDTYGLEEGRERVRGSGTEEGVDRARDTVEVLEKDKAIM